MEDLGGKIATSVSKKVDYVVVGADAGSKADKADDAEPKKKNLSESKTTPRNSASAASDKTTPKAK